jgi:hypothetical protein
MRKPNRRETVLGLVLVGVGLYAWHLDRATERLRARNRALASPSKTVQAERESAERKIGAAGWTRPAGRRAGWGLDPFDRPFARFTGTVDRIPQRANRSAESAFRLQAILWGKGSRVALVDGRVVAEGDSLEGYRVERIEPERVILEGLHGERKILEMD